MSEHIYLVGYRGVGKSTVGPLVASLLGRPFFDADQHLERVAGRSIREMFTEEGEAYFRDCEQETLAELTQLPPAVIATGGGVIGREANRAVLRAGWTVWLQADLDVIAARILGDSHRPNLRQGGRDEIAELLREREPLYAEVARYVVRSGERSPEAVADAILRAWQTRPQSA